RVTRQTDGEAGHMYYTYRFVKPDGTAFTPGTDTGSFYSETRVYPHGNTLGVVRVTWEDGRGNVVREWTGSTSSTWNSSSPPSGSESLTERSRTTTTYDWADRPVATRSYFDLTGLSLAQAGTEGTNYDEM